MAGDFDAITIGSGLGGLTAAALYARAGHRVLVVERNTEIGGAATTYQHGSLRIEGSLHETAQLSTSIDPKARILRALGIDGELEFVSAGPLYEIRSRLFDPPFVLPTGDDAAQAALADQFPLHRKAFRRFFQRVEAVRSAMGVVGEEHNSAWWFLHAPTLPLTLWPLLRDMRHSLSEVFADLFGDDELPKMALAANLGYYGDDPDRLWWVYYALGQGGYLSGGGAYIKGGSASLSRSLADVVCNEGGELLAGRTVTEIFLDEQGRAAGVAHTGPDGADRRVDHAPVLFGNAAPAVLADALPPECRSAFSNQFAGRELSTSLFSVAVGLDRPAREFGLTHYSTVLLPDWCERLTDFSGFADLLAGPPGNRMPGVILVDYESIDSGLNPPDVHLVSITGVDRLANWKELDESSYEAKRQAWLQAIIGQVDRSFPGFASAVVHQEMATAATMAHYLNTPDGAVYGFAQVPPQAIPTAGTPKGVETTVPGLWLASTFGGFGGFSGAMLSGMLAARAALKSQVHSGAAR
ncbi:phytoene desaturase family protein [Mycobacterium sp. Z3061]|uniref:phytoene desaturase family protein n=1 Tax=Mycobacterium sp. Z3061 TaxID=3073562 RepID=UPI0028731C76|nr:NAD(P)/FAD-dependent oxidoreductase [Mycobacterium sp. Z3061]